MASYALVARENGQDVVIMLIDTVDEAQEIAAAMRQSGHRVAVQPASIAVAGD